MPNTTFLIDDFVNVKPGKAFRLFPFGKLVKGGKIIEITKELASRFRLPHFRPPIKLGSHDDTTPAGGHIVGLEVRDDGLYAIPEFTDKGATALDAGDYRYHSPEVIWEGGGLEHPETGETLEGPMIVGDALLHTPHLGEAAALYSVEPINNDGGTQMSDATVNLPVSVFDRLMARFAKEPEEPKQEIPLETPVDEYTAKYETAQAEVDKLAAQVADMEAQAEQGERVAHFAAELTDTVLVEDAEIHALLAGLDEESATAVLTKFKALSAQINESALTGDLGNSGDADERPAVTRLNDLAAEKMKEAKVDYNAAFAMVKAEQPDLYDAYQTELLMAGRGK